MIDVIESLTRDAFTRSRKAVTDALFESDWISDRQGLGASFERDAVAMLQ